MATCTLDSSPREQVVMSYKKKHNNRHSGQKRQEKTGEKSEQTEDPLATFDRKFDPKSCRVFVACPHPIRDASKLICSNYGNISVCDAEATLGLTLIHYHDRIEDELKEKARNGIVPSLQDMYCHVKGCIFETSTGQLKARGYPFTPCLKVSEQDYIKMLDALPPKTYMREFKEGNVIKIWTYRGTVYASATRRINSLRSKKDGCPSTEEMLKQAGIENITKFGNDKGEVYIVLLVHPYNQIQNPEPVEAAVYHLDTWAPVESGKGLVRAGQKGEKKPVKDAFFSMKRKEVNIGLPRLPVLSKEQALSLYLKNKALYVQKTPEQGVVYRSLALDARYVIRGEREHLYHRYVELQQLVPRIDAPPSTQAGDVVSGSDQLLDCVPYALKERVDAYPARFASDLEALTSYVEGLFEPEGHAPPADTSLYALYKSAERAEGPLRERIHRLLFSCRSVVLYNMISVLRTKVMKRTRGDISDEGSRTPSPLSSSTDCTT